ncbi:MAG TPA: 4a-hydroxytetrahydrobiopterin dehydratase [Caulobacteraceae bacterium]|jgi:4a-hydroxytetrahydrobiopterin dehydratase|nr:4a-hydroxytetrahydrobiopterin dehydratase [Caulobacteraceae bacterium]
MSRPARIGAAAALQALTAEGVEGWAPAAAGRDAIVKTYRFAGFAEAFAWMTRVAFEAERLDHHPEWSNIYDRVDVLLATHDAGGATQLDVELARRMEAFARSGV